MAMSDEWMEWTRSNLRQGSAPAELRQILLRHGIAEKDIRFAFRKTLSKKAFKSAMDAIERQVKHGGRNPDADYEALATPRLVRECDGENIVCIEDGDLQLYTIPKFLDDEQCQRVIDIVSKHAYPSTVAVNQVQNADRTSSTCDLAVSDHPYMAEIDAAIERALGISLGWSEVNQGQWYAPGQQYKAHRDFFLPGTDEYARFAAEQGQRTWTFMIYLNDVEAGGGTRFTKIDRTLMPEKGRAVAWNNLRRDGTPNPNSEHCGMPVEAGHKYIITKWFKDRGEGPPFVENSAE